MGAVIQFTVAVKGLMHGRMRTTGH